MNSITKEQTTILSDHFKVMQEWNHLITPDNFLEKTAFLFTMKNFEGVYFKTKEPLPDNYGIGMDCFQLEFDTDNGIYLKDGDMRFNDFMGEQIKDSGVDAIEFIKSYLTERGLERLIK